MKKEHIQKSLELLENVLESEKLQLNNIIKLQIVRNELLNIIEEIENKL